MSDQDDLKNITNGMAGLFGNDPEGAFNEMFKDQIAEAEKGPSMPDTITLEYSDGTKETLTTKSK